MVLRYDEKGKFFTEFISKNKIQVTIQTATNLISGAVYVREGERLSDELNNAKCFIAVADATIFDKNGVKLYSSDFMAVHRDQIIWLMPEHDSINEPTHTVESIP